MDRVEQKARRARKYVEKKTRDKRRVERPVEPYNRNKDKNDSKSY